MLAGFPRHSRHVGHFLKGLNVTEAQRIPWHRVLSSKGHVSPRGCPEILIEQSRLLRAEGVQVNETGDGLQTQYKVDLKLFGWFPTSTSQ